MPQGVAEVNNSNSELKRNVDAVLKIGYDYVEAAVGMLMALSDEEFNDAVDAGVKIEVCNCFIPGTLSIMNRDPGLDEYVEKAMYRMSKVGCDTVVLGSGGARRIPDGMSSSEAMDAFCAFLTICEKHGKEYGVTVVLEPLNELECNFLNCVTEGYTIVKDSNLPHIKLLADIYHMSKMNEPFSVIKDCGDMLKHIHICEDDRLCPGFNSDSDYLPQFAKALRETGYQGRVTIECIFSDFVKEIEDAIPFLRKYF